MNCRLRYSTPAFAIVLLIACLLGLAEALKPSLLEGETELSFKAPSAFWFFLFAEIPRDLLPASSLARHESAIGWPVVLFRQAPNNDIPSARAVP